MVMLYLLLLCVANAAPLPPPPAMAPHPRLVLTPERLSTLREAVSAGGDAAAFALSLKAHADWSLTQPPVPRGQAGASGVLIQVRNSMDILLTTAAQAALTDGVQHGNVYFERALQEALNLCVNWSDWNTVQHALDTGEALAATGLAYDWLYPGLTPSERATLLSGIVSQGLAPYRKYIPNRTTFWWVNNTINWNCVCSAGGVAAVFALQGDAGFPAWAWQEVAAPLVEGVAPCIGAYHADSSWEEGPGYWNYASKYNVWLFGALDSVLGSTLGLSDIPGVAHAARFPLYSAGAQVLTAPLSSSTFNWADAGEGYVWSPFAQWWGGAFGEAAATYAARAGTLAVGTVAKVLNGFAWGGFAEALAFYSPLGDASDVQALPTATLFSFISMGVFRGPWLAPLALQTYAGFKGGDSSWNHNHLDLGSFVLDVNGTRLACDMGADNYALPGYFNDKVRWSYYRLNSRGHNVVLFGNASQAFPAQAHVTAFSNTSATLDLSAPYAAAVASAQRVFTSLNDTRALLVADSFVYHPQLAAAAAPANLTWQLHTRTTPTLLSQYTVSLSARDGTAGLLAYLPHRSTCPSFVGFTLTSLAPLLPPPYDSAAGLTRIDAVVASPAQPGSQCTQLTFALGEQELVAALT